MNDCFENAGKTLTVSRQIPYFETINLYDNINLVLVEGDAREIQVMGGENLIPAITTEVDDSTLVIRNTMKCNWVRDFNNELTVYVPVSSLKAIRYESSGDIKTQGNVNIDSFTINVWGGSGSFNLDVTCNRLDLEQHYGTVDFNITGSSLLTIIYSNSYGPFYCQTLNSNIVYIRSNGTNDCFIHANHILEAALTSIGNIYYTGDPYDLKCTASGSGQLIKIK